MPRDTILLLETSLDKNPRSTRTQIRFLTEFIGNYSRSVDLAARQIHSRSDLTYFLDWARRRPSCKVVHIVGHGSGTGTEARLFLTNEDEPPIDLGKPEDRNIFRGLHRKTLFFSACRIGKSEPVIKRLLDVSGATAVFSYTKNIDDRECFLIESMFYHVYLTQKEPQLSTESMFYDVYIPLREAVGHIFHTRGSRNWLVMGPWLAEE